MPDLTIQVRDTDGLTVVQPVGFINAHTVGKFEKVLDDLVGSGRFSILIDCSDLSYISSAGLGAIMGIVEQVRAGGGDILLCALQENVHIIFETLGFTALYRIFPDETRVREALAGRS
nr:STAS domain-containing protein [uncultured Holophaga sp.]